MDILQYALLGIVQGLTEFLPVSSSGHLVLLEHWLHVQTSGLALIVALHVATTIAVLIVYGKDILAIFRERRWGYIGLILLCCIVTAIIFVPFKDRVEAFADSPGAPRFVGAMLILTGLWQFFADWKLKRSAKSKVQSPTAEEPRLPALDTGPWTLDLGTEPPGQRRVGLLAAIVMGIAQAISGLLRGFSRSGSTIGTAIQLGVRREEAARFSFLASVPIVLGGAVLEAKDNNAVAQLSAHAAATAVGFACSLLAGICAIYFVRWALQRAHLSYFGAYCVVVGIIALAIG